MQFSSIFIRPMLIFDSMILKQTNDVIKLDNIDKERKRERREEKRIFFS